MTEKNDWPAAMSDLFIPEASQDFAARIIAEAQPRPEATSGWRDMLVQILMPKPALGIVFSLVFGVGIGWQASASSLVSEFSAEQTVTAETILDTFHFDSGDIL